MLQLVGFFGFVELVGFFGFVEMLSVARRARTGVIYIIVVTARQGGSVKGNSALKGRSLGPSPSTPRNPIHRGWQPKGLTAISDLRPRRLVANQDPLRAKRAYSLSQGIRIFFFKNAKNLIG